MATAVVCDDDAALRTVISALCEEAGIEVVAETDTGGDAVELVRRFSIDVLVLDLSLKDSSGAGMLRQLQEEGLRPAVIVFTAYADDPVALLGLGARQVIEKPDLQALSDALVAAIRPAERGGPSEDRRRQSQPVEPPPPLWRSPSGVASAADLVHSLQRLDEGDAVLGVAVAGLQALQGDVGTLLVADCRLAAARLLRGTLRVQDLLHEAPDGDAFVALLRGGDSRSADAVWQRLTAAFRSSELAGQVHGVVARVDALGPADALARAAGALQGVRAGSPTFSTV
ncbi:MAG: response regulator [Acidimicrobiales bacterium]